MIRDRQDPWSEVEYHFNKADELRRKVRQLRGKEYVRARQILRDRAERHVATAISLREQITGELE